jgi:hypothetical protein
MLNKRLIDVLEPLALTHATTAPGDTATAFLSALAAAVDEVFNRDTHPPPQPSRA